MTDSTSLASRGEIARKALHLASLVLPAAMLGLPYAPVLASLVALSALAISIEIARDRSAAIHARIDRWLGWMMRPVERRPGSGFCGATWVVVAAALLLAAFPPVVAAAAMAIGLVGDAAAALVGRALGRHAWPGSNRTVEGTAGFLVAGMLVAALFGGFPWSTRIAAVVAAAVVEALPVPLNDNLVVPFAAAAALALLG
jgi:dolichol kinase